MRELQSYIPQPAYKFLAGRTDQGWWHGDRRYSMRTLSGLGNLGDYQGGVGYEVPQSSWADKLPIEYHFPQAAISPYYDPATGSYPTNFSYPPENTGVGGNVGCPYLGDGDYGFMWGLERWLPSQTGAVSYGDKLTSAFSGLFNISKWMCQPITQLGTIVPPLVAALLVLRKLDKGRRR